MKAEIIRFIKHAIVLMACSVVAGTLLLVLAFCLPTDSMRKHVFADVDDMLLSTEEVPEAGIENYLWSNREMFTDAIMVQNAIDEVPGQNAYEHAMWVYHYDLGNDVIWMPEDSLRATSEGADTSEMYLRTYARYWHGYLIYLKPLLMIFGWEQIVNIGMVLMLVLLAAVVGLSIRKKQPGVAVVTLAGMLFLKPILVHVSLTMSVCWFITLVALLFMLCRHDWLSEKNYYAEFFLLIGILTAYFDFLTYPIVTLGFPLCAYYLMKKRGTLKENFLALMGYCISWGGGYAGMWAMKWIVADVTMQTGTIRDAVWSIIGRTEAIGGRPRFNGGFYVIGLNLQEYNLSIYTIMAVILLAITLLLLIVACIKGNIRDVLRQILPFLIIACIPFAWIIVVQHHSALHARFTFRIISVTAVAFSAVAVRAIQEITKTLKNK